MKFLHYFQLWLIAVFTVINGFMFYLFLLALPYGIDSFLMTFEYWGELEPHPGIVATITLVAMATGFWLAWNLPDDWKNRLLYLRWSFPHPAFNAFLTLRKQPFENSTLLAAFPQVKDSGFSTRVQLETWHDCLSRYGDVPVVVNTRIHWSILRDLYILSLFFLILFMLSYAVNYGLPFGISAIYVFMFGVQFLFLFLAARRIGLKLVDNVLGVALGIDENSSGNKGKKGKKDRRVI
ncbi:MAG: hypothetical protein GY703_15215 [Gammaproteobacteria bacterium]|nr:hypothetical protein [Gammaproteobacteria bacterium]